MLLSRANIVIILWMIQPNNSIFFTFNHYIPIDEFVVLFGVMGNPEMKQSFLTWLIHTIYLSVFLQSIHFGWCVLWFFLIFAKKIVAIKYLKQFHYGILYRSVRFDTLSSRNLLEGIYWFLYHSHNLFISNLAMSRITIKNQLKNHYNVWLRLMKYKCIIIIFVLF